MIKRSIGIDVGPGFLHAAQILRTAQGFRVEKTFSTFIRRSSDSMPEMLRTLFSRHGFDRRAAVAVSVPRDAVFFRSIHADDAGLEQLSRQNSSPLSDSFPIPADQIIIQACSSRPKAGGGYSILTAAVAKSSLAEMKRILAKAHIRPRLIEAPVCAVHSAAIVNHSRLTAGRALIACIDERFLTISAVADGDLVLVRNIPIPPPSDNDIDATEDMLAETVSAEARITWQKVFDKPIDESAELYLLAAAESRDSLKPLIESNLNRSLTVIDPYAQVRAFDNQPAEPAICVAEGLALRLLDPERTKGLNFIEAENRLTQKPIDVKRELVAYGTLLVAVIVLLIVGLFTRLSRLESAYADTKANINETFTAALPDEKNIVSPLAQMRQKLDALKNDYRLFAAFTPAAMGPIRILSAVSRTAPADADIELEDLLITDTAVRITGGCNSFESVYDWQRVLQQLPDFELVDVTDVRREAGSGRARFTMTISSGKQEKR
ncbi:MAG: hypothetical protein JW720_14925 [Sedimentisphaerales bacterium]|nr:hypothetical protein [Sedimentisphaerales bacterium]